MAASSVCNAVMVYQFRHSRLELTHDDWIYALSVLAKKFVFQLEKSDTGYEHWQGQLSLKKKRRWGEAKALWESLLESDEQFNVPFPSYFQPVSRPATGETFYVTKADTRLDGPWSDQDSISNTPWDVQEIRELRPWQQRINDSFDILEKRRVDILIDLQGNNGKTTLVRYMCCKKRGRMLPYCNDFRDVMRMAMCMPESPLYFIDMPRAISKEKLFQFYAAIETLKGGYAFDDRYSFRERYFGPPRIWVFTNKAPDLKLLSADRWRRWMIDAEDKLVPYRSRTILKPNMFCPVAEHDDEDLVGVPEEPEDDYMSDE